MPEARLYLIGGSESFLIEQAVRDLRKKHVDPALEAFALDIISETEKDPSRIINSLQIIPSFAPSRLVLVDNPFFLKTTRKDDAAEDTGGEGEAAGLDKNSEKLLYAALENLPAGVTAVFINHGALDQRKKFVKFCQKNGQVLLYEEFKPWEKDKAASWISNYLREKNYAIDRQATEFLVEITGLSVGALAAEAEKLMLYAADRTKLTLADVQTMASPGGLNTYDLGEALRRKDLPEVLRLLTALLRDSEAPQGLLGYLAKQLRTFLQVKELQLSRQSASTMAGLLKMNPWKLENIILPDLRQYTLPQLQNAYLELQNADYQMKTGQLD
ncbi:DNA polymerase III subunit delta, partial [Candidatus Termititenax persephonae]